MPLEFTKGHEKKLDRLDEIVRGNGDVGIRADVKANTKSLEVIESAIRKSTRWIITTLLTTLISIGITLALFALSR